MTSQNRICDFFQNRSAVFLLTLLAGIIILFPSHNYQPWLSSGDHGRDLYCFQITGEGAVPYHDYWWVYGPLMPYYYAIFLKIFGLNIQSVLLGKIILNMLSAAFIYWAASTLLSPVISMSAALWFLSFQPDFYYTYNHTGGLTILMLITYCIFHYIKNPKMICVSLSLFLIFILSLVKINIGLSSLGALIISFAAIDFTQKNPLSNPKKYFYLLSPTFFPIFILGFYYLLIRGLPLYYIRQCFPYLANYRPYHTTLGTAVDFLWGMIRVVISESWASFFFAVLVFLCIARTIYFLLDHSLDKALKKNIFLSILVLGLFYLFDSHEYLSSGVIYRVYWATPFSTLLMFVLLGFATHRFAKQIKILLYMTLFLILGLKTLSQYQTINAFKNPAYYLNLSHGKTFTSNPPAWFDTVRATTRYLKDTLKPEETFLALPYDPLYYFLAEKKSPTRQLIFFEHINITREQEEQIISELESKKINYVLMSNRAMSPEAVLGMFGQSYCQILGKYIKDNFETIFTYGDWANVPGWGWNHGTKVLKRVTK